MNQVKENLVSKKSWVRIVFMLIFVVAISLAEVILKAIVIFQLISSLFTGKPNQKLIPFSTALSRYIFAVIQFLTYSSDIKPFPFKDWDDIDLSDYINMGTAKSKNVSTSSKTSSKKKSTFNKSNKKSP